MENNEKRLLLERLDRAEQEKKVAELKYEGAILEFTNWKLENGIHPENPIYQDLKQEVERSSAHFESCKKTYDNCVEAYTELLKKMPNPGTVDQGQFLSALPLLMKQAMKEETESKAVISKVKSRFVNNLLEDRKIKLSYPDCNETISNQLAVSDIQPFEWDSSNEDSAINRNRYITYLKDTIICADFGYPMTVFDATQQPDLLDAEFNEDFAVTGTCDALISSTTKSDFMIAMLYLS